MYNLKVANDKYLTLRSTVLTGFFTTIFYIFTPYISPVLPENRVQIIYLYLSITIAILIWRFIYISFIFSPLIFKRVLLIGSNRVVKSLIEIIDEKAHDNFVVGYIAPREFTDIDIPFFKVSRNIEKLVQQHQVTEIVVETFTAQGLSNKITPQLIHLFEKGFTITSSDNFKESITNRVPESRLNEAFYNHLSFSKSQENRLYIYAHRAFNIVVSLIGILFFTALIPIIVICNLIGNRGSLFYFQSRVGRGGKIFKIIKLRSMVPNAESGKAIWAKKNDKRVTKFGKFLRKTRLDEVPQFFNVLKGEMSLIGPRPERPEFVKELSKEFPFYATRHVIKPGLTGWAQVEYPYAMSKEEQMIKLRYDLFYIKERNLLLDLKIVIKTISTVLFFRGT
jgi:exopolysaccharide biosynthesis polyprenyl glycosylphosphotransferase